MKQALARLALILLSLWATAYTSAAEIKYDVDNDGIPDFITLSASRGDDESEITQTIKITYSKTKTTTSGTLSSDSGSINVYPGSRPGELVVDYSNRSSRDSAELSYEVYRWSEKHGKLCLHSSVNGIPANQLKHDLIPTETSISLYECCATPGGDEQASERQPTPIKFNDTDLSDYMNNKIPEWKALELTARLDQSSLKNLVKIASSQNELQNPSAAAIMLDKITKAFPQRTDAFSLLASIYADHGNKDKACAMYKSLTTQATTRQIASIKLSELHCRP